MYCSSKLHTSTLPSQSQLASQLSSPVHMLRSYCHFQFTVLEVIFLTLTYLSEDWVVGIPEPVCAKRVWILALGFLLPTSLPQTSRFFFACSRMLPLYSMLLCPYCSGGHVLRPESLRELGTQFLSDVSDKATFSSHPVHTRCCPWPRLGHVSCPRHDGILFSLYYPFKKFRTTWKPACFGRGNGYKAFTQLAREAYRCVPVRAWRCAGTSFLCDGSVFSQMSRSSCWGPSTPPESVLLRRCRVDVNGSEIERWKTHLDSFGYLLTWISILHLYWQGFSHLKDSKTTETSKTRHQHWWQKKTPTPMLNSSVIASRNSSLCSAGEPAPGSVRFNLSLTGKGLKNSVEGPRQNLQKRLCPKRPITKTTKPSLQRAGCSVMTFWIRST